MVRMGVKFNGFCGFIVLGLVIFWIENGEWLKSLGMLYFCVKRGKVFVWLF